MSDTDTGPLTWIIGTGGLLGSTLAAQLRRRGRDCFAPAEPWAWDQPERLSMQLRRALTSFGDRLRPGQRWEIHWSAGRAAMTSAGGELEADRRGFQALVESLAEGSALRGHRGLLVLASSAGGIHAASKARWIDEQTPPEPNNPYGHWKLEQEELIRGLVAAGHADGAFIARISTLYGVGRANSRRAGLIRTIAHQLLRRQPVKIFVPLDTMRDYIIVQDAAALILAGSELAWGRILRGEGNRCLTRLVASEQPTAVSELLGIFRRLTRRQPLVLTSISGPAHLYSRCVQYRSICQPELRQLVTTPLALGIAAVLQAERRAMARGMPR
ncbi:MAG: NAD-dependent epimerase/dehydratase family protein [Synechococcaceae cyanobacterium]|nr:NAD-dependent epimerase/dehydratase family protein [Synechococcaceae cyanobacterium]